MEPRPVPTNTVIGAYLAMLDYLEFIVLLDSFSDHFHRLPVKEVLHCKIVDALNRLEKCTGIIGIIGRWR